MCMLCMYVYVFMHVCIFACLQTCTLLVCLDLPGGACWVVLGVRPRAVCARSQKELSAMVRTHAVMSDLKEELHLIQEGKRLVNERCTFLEDEARGTVCVCVCV